MGEIFLKGVRGPDLFHLKCDGFPKNPVPYLERLVANLLSPCINQWLVGVIRKRFSLWGSD